MRSAQRAGSATTSSIVSVCSSALSTSSIDSSERLPSHPVGLIRPTDLQDSADAEDQRSEGEMPKA